MKKMPSRLHTRPDRLTVGDSWRAGMTSAQRGYDHQWRKYRVQFLREHPICQIAGEGCELAAWIVDHIKPHRGDQALFWNPANHQSACEHCHNAHKQRQENATR